ncbi:methyl-accepting chemotaxis protein [Geodermatophilus sp. URMC 63]
MPRNTWSDRPLGVKLSALVGAGALALGAVTLIAVQEFSGAGDRTQVLLDTTHATAEGLEADMMHDAVRADVLQALQAAQAGRVQDLQAAQADLQEHSAALQEHLDAVVADGLGTDVEQAVTAVTPAVDDYLAAAAQLVATAGRDVRAAQNAYPQFLTAFTDLEQELPSVGDAVGAHARRAADETTAQLSSAGPLVLTVAGAAVLVLGLLGWAVTRSVVGPLRRVGAVVAAMAAGDLRGATGVDSRDEVGRMAVALETSMGAVRTVLATIGDSSTTLASATEELSASAQDLSRLAVESADQSGIVAGAAEQVSQNVQTVAAGSEEMGVSIREIAQNASEVARVASQAVVVADSTTSTVAKLGESSLEIAGVVKAITTIAEQTNLLALNATIEAARAGEAGKGFAVVANEVKELAQETARATQDITTRVQAIQTDTEGAVTAIGEISSIIGLINDSQGTIAAAVEEQTATTTEMNRNVAEAALSAGQIAENIQAVAGASTSTTRAMQDARSAIDEVARLASGLQASVAHFRW